MSVSSPRWQTLERWSPTLFLVAGASLVVHAGNHALEAFTTMNYPLHHEVPFGVLGMVLGFVALLGLVPKLADVSPLIARAGAVLAALGAVGWIVVGTTALARDLGMSPPEWLGAVAVLIFLGVLLGYLTFGVAGIRTEIVSRTTGLALLTPVIVMVMNVAIASSGYGSPTGQFVVASGFALSHLAIGAALRNEDFPSDRAERVAGTAS